eukprot:CAMPEP_0183785228 /NCGR_PEP_ID=MMETSP0739-20130205/66396_1 /TAXON_ID=385413 /ORGANISM="Thalassiosira miniscula, Strain CCMP1093" /LENGTH=297 /DNA_ID=CAMNT_0026029225 /DNA_START=54 /DNA_END=947 /DNA_ORIENTATION=-
MLESVRKELEKEKTKVQELTEAQEKMAIVMDVRAMESDKVLKQLDEEKKKMKDEMAGVTAKHKKEIGMYDQSMFELQAQVDSLREMAGKTNIDTTEELRHNEELMRQAKEEVRQELITRINTQKLEYESALIKKNANIADLREKCIKHEESMRRLEDMCAKARIDLLHLKDQKKFLEGSLEQSIQYIKNVRESQDIIVAEDSGAKELVAEGAADSGPKLGLRRCHEDILNDLENVCGPIIESNTPKIKLSELHKTCGDLGSDLDALLLCIETQLGVGKSGATRIKSKARNDLSTKSW